MLSKNEVTGQSSSVPEETLSHLAQMSSRLFDLLSGGDLDHPLCSECAEFMQEYLDKEVAELQKETVLYEKVSSSPICFFPMMKDLSVSNFKHQHHQP